MATIIVTVTKEIHLSANPSEATRVENEEVEKIEELLGERGFTVVGYEIDDEDHPEDDAGPAEDEEEEEAE